MKPAIIKVLQSLKVQRLARANAATLSLAQVAQLSGIKKTVLLDLVDHGALLPVNPTHKPSTFNLGCVMMLQYAEGLRQDLALDSQTFAAVVMLLTKVSGFQSQSCDGAIQVAQSPCRGLA